MKKLCPACWDPARREILNYEWENGSWVAKTGGGSNGSLTLLFDDSLILVMRTDPDPDKVHTVLHRERAMIDPSSRGPHYPDFLEMQRGVRWIFL